MSALDQLSVYWRKDVRFLQSGQDKWLFILFINSYSAVFLLFFQPFGVNNYDPTHRISHQLLVGLAIFFLVNTSVMILYEFVIVPLLFRKKARYVFAMNMLSLLILLSSSTYLTYSVLGNFHDWSWGSYFGFIRDIGLMTSIPLVLLLLFLQHRQVRQEVKVLQKDIVNNYQSEEIICLSSSNGKDRLFIAVDQLLLLEAQDNYVAVYHRETTTVKRALLRSSLKRLEKQLEKSRMIRCHRSYIIHPMYIEKVSGNTHQLQVRLKGLDKTIPVSRKYTRAITTKLDTRHI